MAKKKSANKPAKSFEESLWETATIYKLVKMNLAVRGRSANLGEVLADKFFKDQHPDPASGGTDTTTRESVDPILRRSQTVGRPRSGGQQMADSPFNTLFTPNQLRKHSL